MIGNILSVALSGGAVIDLDGTLLVQTAIFFTTLLVLYKLVFKPMLDVFDARESAIDGAKEAAAELSAGAQDKAGQFDEEVRKLKISAGQERERLRGEGLALERTIVEKVRAETQETLRQATEQLDREAKQVREQMQREVPVLARRIAGKILGREVA